MYSPSLMQEEPFFRSLANASQCDLQRPQCSQCVKSNRVCTGYQRKRIFIFHQGTQETHYETSRNGPGTSTTPVSRSTTSPCQESNITFFSTHTRGRRSSPRTRNQISTLESNRSLLHVTYRKQLFNAYLRSHIPCSQLQSLGTPWLALIPELASPTEALETSTLALATSKLGRLNNDPILIRESLRLYTFALRQLQKALWNPGLMYRDETLAACMALAMYEMMECPSGDKSGYMSHCNGLNTLVRLRGPNAHVEGLGHRVFLAFRVHAVSSLHFPISPKHLPSSYHIEFFYPADTNHRPYKTCTATRPHTSLPPHGPASHGQTSPRLNSTNSSTSSFVALRHSKPSTGSIPPDL